ncbi:hypothetical protein [Marinifilum caeruleilacunae]|uniref:O-antigen ligase domain-containing protein n=1 Tax=Marinifilum caeruleilacunae TaxID=2499076 RepID=A0ABX1WR05_9BACT|nr:hypothetical protein [Marinifilum caeruleilacunae]NOU58417.1 hypothetical protein [Marinifilum caeruleilacunae]
MFKTYLHYAYWSLIFFTGLMQLMGFSSAIYKIGVPFLLFVLLGLQIIESWGKFKTPFIGWIAVFSGVSVLSTFINGLDTFSLIYFLIYTLISYFYFLVLINEDSVLLIKKVVGFIKILVLLQVPAAILKFISKGQSEDGIIGTLTIQGGSVSTIFPLFVILILFSIFLFQAKLKYLYAIGAFILFAIIGDKRAILLFIPLFFIIGSYVYVRLSKLELFTKLYHKLFIVGLFGIVAFVFVAKTNRTLNPEHSRWGSVDLYYIGNYIQEYTQGNSEDKAQLRRKDGLLYFINHMKNEKTQTAILGDGAGKLIQSQYNTRSGLMLDEYGVRYGGRMGFVWLLTQVGFLGVTIYLLFYCKLFAYVWKYYIHHPIYLAFLLLTLLFFVDTFIYSYVFLRFEFVKGLYFVILALIFLDQKYKSNYFTDLVLK